MLVSEHHAEEMRVWMMLQLCTGCCVGHGSFPGALYGGHCSLQGLSLGLEALAVVVALTLQLDNGCGVGMMCLPGFTKYKSCCHLVICSLHTCELLMMYDSKIKIGMHMVLNIVSINN